MWKTGKPLVSGTDLLQWQGFPHFFYLYSDFPCSLVTGHPMPAPSQKSSPWAMATLSPLRPLCPGRSLWMSVRKALDFTTFTCRWPRHATACIAPRRFGWPGWPGWSHGFHARLQKSHQFIQNHPIMWEFIWVYYEKPFPIKLEHHDGMSTNNLIY